jgi:hypothetical protein
MEETIIRDPANYKLSLNRWGPTFWSYLHTVALGMPLEPNMTEQAHYNNVMKIFASTIPCPSCKSHLMQELEKAAPLPLYSRHSFFQLTVDLHNAVNIRYGKRVFTFEEALAEYVPMDTRLAIDTLRVVPKQNMVLTEQSDIKSMSVFTIVLIVIVIVMTIVLIAAITMTFMSKKRNKSTQRDAQVFPDAQPY